MLGDTLTSDLYELLWRERMMRSDHDEVAGHDSGTRRERLIDNDDDPCLNP